MFAATKKLQGHRFKALITSVLLQSKSTFNNAAFIQGVGVPQKMTSVTLLPSRFQHSNSSFLHACFRSMSTARGRSMRAKVEARMRKESGKTLKEIRRAKKMKLKLMDDNERLVYNLKRAKKKVALLLQKLKKYELPELAASVHDPELFTLEQLQAYKKIGYKNKNYVPVGVRGVFGGVVQNMHMHWKFHETVQVCCDNFPKEKIKEMATMIARLSGGIVINIHNTKTIIMFRGRNYRQPKNLIPFNTLTKRKALFKARFEQALESQKLNIKKIEQELRKKGVNPEDPVAMASIQRVASTFFNAIDKKEGSPYVFQAHKLSLSGPSGDIEHSDPPIDSDQEELDQFIAEIEDAADKEWVAEEEAEKEELGQIRYLNREDFGGRYRRSRNGEDSGNENRGARGQKDNHSLRTTDSDDEDDYSEGDEGWDSDNDRNDPELGGNYSRETRDGFKKHQGEWSKPRNPSRANCNVGHDKNSEANLRWKKDEYSESENMFGDLEIAMWESSDEDEDNLSGLGPEASHKIYRSRSDSYKSDDVNRPKGNRATLGRAGIELDSESEDTYNGAESSRWKLDDNEDSEIRRYSYQENGKEGYQHRKKGSSEVNTRREKTRKELDETWDSD